MYFRFYSDIHLECDAEKLSSREIAGLWGKATEPAQSVGMLKNIPGFWSPRPLPSDGDTVLLLLGDIWNGTRPLSFAGANWMAGVASRFKAVVVVLGNHDYWTSHLTDLPRKWRAMLAETGLDNVHLLELADGVDQGSVVVDGVRILGGTLWTDMHRGDPIVQSKFDFELGMGGKPLWNDRNFIRAGGYSKFGSRAWLSRHRATVANLRKALTVGDEPVLLATHHSPCMVSAPPYGNDALASYFYASDLSELILDNPRITRVLHGHTHTKLSYMMGDVRVQCNPRGYAPGDTVDGFAEVEVDHMKA